MSDLRAEVINAVDEKAHELNNLSQDIWKKPELAFQEYSAHDCLTSFLEKEGFQVDRKFKLETAFRATFGVEDPSKPNIAVLCEYDALPGIGHACGHNLIAEVGIGAALAIKALLQKTPEPLGKLTVLGTPAEEGGGGKIILMKHGVFDNIDVAMMAHPTPNNITKMIVLARSKLFIKYIGRASHAAGFPWDGVNALDAAVLCYQSISCLRQQFKPMWRVHGVITNGGVKPNIIPDVTELQYSLRTSKDSELKLLEEKIVRCVQSAAQATGCKVEYRITDDTYNAMLYNSTLCKLYEKNASSVGVEVNNDAAAMLTPLGSTDMGNVSTIVPSIHPCFHMGTKEANHTVEFTSAAGAPEAQPFTLKQAKALALTALDIYSFPDILKDIREDFRKDKENS